MHIFRSTFISNEFVRRGLFSIMLLLVGLCLAPASFAQQPPLPDADGPPPPGGPHGRGEGGPHGPAMHLGPPGRWWDDPNFAEKISLSADQKKKMDEIFNASLLKLIDLRAAVQKEEAIMEPLVEADPPDEAKVLAQIDRVAQARGELEKANARMLFELRRQLTHDQWTKLQAERPPAPPGHKGPPEGPGRPPGN